ncbi:hypothetical protein TNCV_3183121 [Trichonephila clavipes]|uniref:Uncharacterized protein n=1 Tax=Trichonephila clavipes TaxID=2585209 RepID=A0A8X6SDB9_TRICX|nr:hypothetical protein TNCV_3183121 [Trichonephila clavipes]
MVHWTETFAGTLNIGKAIDHTKLVVRRWKKQAEVLRSVKNHKRMNALVDRTCVMVCAVNKLSDFDYMASIPSNSPPPLGQEASLYKVFQPFCQKRKSEGPTPLKHIGGLSGFDNFYRK